MRRLLLASSALVVAGSAFAADLPTRLPAKAPPVVAAIPYTWTGCYVGGHVGAGWDRTTFTDPGNVDPFIGGAAPRLAPAGASIGVNGGAGVLGGVQAGCDYQFAGNWVVGIGGDFAWTDIHGLANDPFFVGKNGAPVPISTRTDMLASVTGRVGYAWDRFLVYGKGGGAWTHDKYSISNLNCAFFTACNLTGSTDRIGWTAGVGVEWAFAPNWSALVEYNHYGFGNKSIAFTDPAVPVTQQFVAKQNVDVVKVGINYRFGGPGAVVARY